ncbi:MAG: zinc-binding alcohol dehydrogenase family protein [Gammaproteobacteria bacterium]|nr:zinc-binding alcohol dehydrogenase family protein [Gammaproteobacteria bacterium]
MKAFGFSSNNSKPQLIELTTPQATDRDVLVKIDAIAVNPVDTKVVAGIKEPLSKPKVVGWDASGTVTAIGENVELFKIGDKVFYAGDVTRSGCYASHQLVDERIVAHAPKSLSAAEAAAIPLTTITAWEALFSRLKVIADLDAGKKILIIGGAGGVGSIAIQLAKVVGKLTVITTASRTESEQWCQNLGADYVLNHHSDLAVQYRSLNIDDPDYILCLNNTDRHFEAMADLIAPQGMICSIVGTQEKHDLDCLKSKSAGFVWEFMFTRPMFKTPDILTQHHLLNTVSQLLDDGQLKSTLTSTLGPINTENIVKAHQQLLTGKTIGKVALTAITD